MRSAVPAGQRGEEDPRLPQDQLRQVAQLHAVVFVFYAVDGVLLTAFGALGALPPALGAAYAVAGWCSAGLAVRGFRRGRRTLGALDRNNAVMTVLAAAQMLLTALVAPPAGVFMLMTLMTVLVFSALQLPGRKLLAVWAACSAGVLGVLLAGPADLGPPMATPGLRLVGAAWFAWLLAKCALTTVEGTRLRKLVNDANGRLVQALAGLETLATTDELTVIPNRRSIVSGLHAAIEGAGDAPASVAVVLFDIDHFKRVNDGFGHAVGDAVLREFASLVSRSLRPSDRVGRYGGEEFLLVLLQVGTVATACDAANRTRLAVESFDWSRLAGGLRLTASAGVALVGPDESGADAIARADRALYRAKAAGRNRVVFAGPDAAP